MKNKLSFLSLVAAAALPCGNAFAENNVIVYDATKNQVAAGADLKEVFNYINGKIGYEVDLYANTKVATQLKFTLTTLLNILSNDGSTERLIIGSTNQRIIESTSDLTLICDKINFTGGAITSALSGNPQVGGGAIRSVSGTITLGGNGKFTKNTTTAGNPYSSGDQKAGAIYAKEVKVSENSKFSFSSNKIIGDQSQGNYGGAICGTLTVGKNATIDFSSNLIESLAREKAQGGAVYGDVSIASGANGKFSQNSIGKLSESATSVIQSAYGGAISGNLTLENDATVTFSKNRAYGGNAYGGAVSGNVSVGSSSKAYFQGNSLGGRPPGTTTNTFYYFKGGSIFGNLTVEENGNVEFSQNSISASSYGAATTHVYGGAICGNVTIKSGAKGIFSSNSVTSEASIVSALGGAIKGHFTVESGANVTFSENSAIAENVYKPQNVQGGAICHGTVTIKSGSTVKFSKNYVSVSSSTSGDSSTAQSRGGAIFGNANFSGNVEFSENETRATQAIPVSSGGAIYSPNFIHFNLEKATDNILFSKNSSRNGGAIYSEGILDFSGSGGTVKFESNIAATRGGAIYHTGASTTDPTLYIKAGAILNFTGNRAETSQGGAIYSEAAMSFAAGSKTTFTDNFAAKDGGAIRTTQTLTFLKDGSETHSFSNNATNASGGAIATMNTLTVEERNTVKFSGNTARTYGGAIYGGNSSTALSFYSTGYAEFSKNRAASGGAIYSVGRINLLGDFTFSQNQSNELGGAVYSGSSVTFGALSNGTFSGNTITATTELDTRGGAVNAASVTFKGKTTFENNTITAVGSKSINSGGGAVYASGAVTFGDTANVKFEGNTISSAATQSFGGGAIFANTLKLAGTVEFTNNSVKNTTLSTLFSSGGAIFSFSGMEIASGTTATFSGNSAAYGGAINAYKGYLTFTEGASVTFRGNSAARGGAIYADAGTFTLAGDVKFLDNTASAQAGAIQIGEATLECTGDTTRVVFSGNRVGSDSKGWKNNDILLVKATSAMAIRDAGTYDFGGGILATAGGSLSIDEANVTFRATSATAIGGTTTVSGGATVSMEAGATFTTKALTVRSSGKLVFGTQGAESASIVVADAANISLDATACLELAASSAYAHSARYDLIEWTSGDGSALAAGLTRDNFSVMMNGLACDDAMWIFGVDANSIYVELIPEPSHFGVFAGLAALALAGTRRRRKKA